jgi:radical SAM protein with 4Fe4S-binding SPASM domain
MTACQPHPIIMWEMTRACDLECRQCAFSGADKREPNDLSTYAAYKTIDQIAALCPREVILTGGDPLERQDVGEIIDYAIRRGLDPALVASPTGRLTAESVEMLARHGLSRMVFSIDGATPESHDAVRGTSGCFATTLEAMRLAVNAGMALEVNTLVSPQNVDELPAIVDVIRPFSAARWNVHFVVPVGGSRKMRMLTAEETEAVFAVLEGIRGRERFALRVVEAPHYRRFRLQRRLEGRLQQLTTPGAGPDRFGLESEDRREAQESAIGGFGEFAYISHAGDVQASAFLPHRAGNLRFRSLEAMCRRGGFFTALGEEKSLHGKCGRCEFRTLCGGSRARAWAMTGDLFGSDPVCAYDPEPAPVIEQRLDAAA